MKKANILGFYIIMILLSTALSEAQQTIEIGTIYKLGCIIDGFKDVSVDDAVAKKLKAGKGSKIYIYKADDNDYYVEFKTLFSPKDLILRESYVQSGQAYKIDKNILTSANLQMSLNLTSGTLIVPFKLRSKDGSLTGDATIGVYAGIRKELWLGIETTFLASFGLSAITTSAGDDENDTNLGLTGGVGFLIKNWDKVEIGIIAGIDHLGGEAGDNWKYEDDFWFSFMVGYNFD